MGKLNVKQLKKITKPGRYGDGNGLYLHIRNGGSKQWMLRTTVQRKRTDIGLGSLIYVNLTEAREKAYEMRKIAKDGRDPLFEKRKQFDIPLFEIAAETVWKQNLPTWKNVKHRAQWINTLRRYAFPHIGKLRLDEITSAHLMKVLSPIWLEKPETARRVKQRLNTVFDWAKASGFRNGDSPLSGLIDALPKQRIRPKHHKALSWQDLPEFMETIVKRKSMSALALQFIILTATRSGETRLAVRLHIKWHRFKSALRESLLIYC